MRCRLFSQECSLKRTKFILNSDILLIMVQLFCNNVIDFCVKPGLLFFNFVTFLYKVSVKSQRKAKILARQE